MRSRSKKKQREYVERRKLVKRLLEEHPYCQACPVFAEHDGEYTYVRSGSVDIHELKRRSQGGSITDESNCMAVCRKCHQRIGDHPQLAFHLGLAKQSWMK